jgi:pimeloyl-ACP methyl ester carboxylesterase
VTVPHRRVGAGPPLVVVNGFAATKDDWDPTFIDALASGFELVLVENRGMGQACDDGEPFTIGDLAADVAELIRALGLDRPAVLGWSMGGYVAIAVTLSNPEDVSRLVLLSTSGGGDLATLADPEVRRRLRDTSGSPREQATRLISLLFPPERARQIDAEFGDIVARARAALPADVVRRQWEAMEAWERGDAGQDARRIDRPVLIATGQEDVVIPPANSLALAEAIPGSWLARFPGSGHGFMADYPDALAGLIAAFLNPD